MKNIKKRLLFLSTLLAWIFPNNQITAQNTQIRGFIESYTTLQDDKLSFGFGEQDLFITSEMTDHLSFLGESVFKFSSSSPTLFDVSIERVVIKYNFKGNHSLLIGKHHTPLNYWNDSYHHGRVFFPTIGRPLLFAAEIIPIHTTGIGLQAQNLGKLRWGYDLLIGNGIGSGDIVDNDKYKSISVAVHFKPLDGLQIRTSYYHDVISAGAEVHGEIVPEKVNQQLLTGTVAYFGRNFEVLAETTLATNDARSTGKVNTFASYLYAGVKIKEKWVPYFRIDNLNYRDNEVYFDVDDTTSFVMGLRYEINYLAVVKLEYQYEDGEVSGTDKKLTAQIAIGF